MMLFLWIPLFLCIPASAMAPTRFCPATVCGGVNITYPFWVLSPAPSNATSFCGYRDLNVTCDPHLANKPTLRTKLGDYTVSAFDGGTRTFTLLDPDAVTGEACPHVRRNFTVQRAGIDLLEYGPEVVNLTFFYNCSGERKGLIDEYRIRCPGFDGDGRNSYVFAETAVNPAHASLYNNCIGPLVAPVMRSAVIWKNTSAVFHEALAGGFQLRWGDTRIETCEACERNKGYCGSNDRRSVDGGLLCVCEDGSPDARGNCSRADGPGTKQPKWKIIVSAVGGAGFVAVLVGLFLFFWKRFRPTKRSASLSKLIRSASSDSYSMEKDVEALSSQTHIFSYRELEEATEGFADVNELGDGGFGTVYKGKLRDGRVVAIKRLYENNFKREGQFLNEVAILNRLRHKNLVSLYGCTSRHSRGLLLVYEYVPNGTVADHLHGPRVQDGALTWPVRMNIAIETAGALTYLHAVEPQIIHRDVKTNNILLDENYHVKVGDFGLSRLFPPDATHVSTVPQGTPGYLDPEYHQCYQLTDKSDVYSFGVVLAELISSKPAVDITRKRNDINLANMAISMIQNCQLQELVDPLLGYDSDDVVRIMIEQVAELAFRCLQAEKEMRPSMEEVLEVLKGITGAAAGERRDHCHLGGKVEQVPRKVTDDCASLLNGSVQYSPDTVHADWVSRTTTPNTSGQTLT